MILCIPAASPSPVETMVILSMFASGEAKRPHHFRQAGDQLVDHRRLVPFLISLRLHAHGLGFGLAFLQNDLGLGLALRADGGGVAFSFRRQPRLLGAGQRFDAAAFNFRLLEHAWRSARSRGA